MKYKIPSLKNLLEPPKEFYKPGYGLKGPEGKLDILEQGTTPKDKELLKKLGIKKEEKILAIAAFYASWAKELQKSGAKVSYSDISKQLVNWARKNPKINFENYLCSNYELIPKNEKEYDWTFTYEACGAGRGLSIAYLRSLLNSKGGILIIQLGDKNHQIANASKIQKYPNMVKTLSQIYGSKPLVVKKKIRGYKRSEKNIQEYEFLISKIKTNPLARKKSKQDLEILNYLDKKKKINLEQDSKKIDIDKKELKSSIKRLNKISKLINEKYLKEIII